MKCPYCKNPIDKNDKTCPNCQKSLSIMGEYIIILGGIIFGFLFSLCVKSDISMLYPAIILTLINIAFCIISTRNQEKISLKIFIPNTMKNIIIAILMAFFVSMVILINSPSCLFCIDSYGFEYLLVPFVSIFTYIPILIEIFIIFIKQQKYTIHIFASIIVLLIIYNIILLIGTPLETNNLEKTLPFSTVTITYDSKKDEPKVNPEKLKYYHNGHTYYFLLEPGTYKIYTESNNRIDIHKNKFYRYNKIFESAKHGFKISKIKKENQIYRYEVDYENSKIYDKISKDDSNYIRSFESDEECILVKYGFNKLDEIKIVKQD